jgi:hypothetical protein
VSRSSPAQTYAGGDVDLWETRLPGCYIRAYRLSPIPADDLDVFPCVPENATLVDRLEAWAVSDWTEDLSIGEHTLAKDCREAARLLRDTDRSA